ncbi:sensor histidine kinase [Paenibacillus planticolens]|uniref:histidine kinase n=1 Tax=Paenibacillus planticolens TaxID=2654976 RepID=A0ABX1ZTS2_9BACL|nr:HAMP domain-containing sensor histidine kinase [Paenibacillus planticolens]NOV02254.1 HAMP domain-containing protein [Paenibacillus planticolens]
MLHTIRGKLLIGFFLIFLLFFLILNQMVARNIESGNHKIMTDSLISLKNNSSAYVRQSFMIHHFANDELYFGQIAEEMAKDLQHDTATSISMYSITGEMLFASDPALFTTDGEDLTQALLGKTAYRITYENGTASVLFAFPVIVEGTKVGIVRFAKDFTLLYEQSTEIRRTIFVIAMAVFAAAFLFTYLLSRHITVPLVKLSNASSEVMKGKLDTRLSFRRKDEIGKLAANFNNMIERIQNQITTIEQDRDQLEELNQARKRFFDNVTHELKTPLTTIMGYATLIQENGSHDQALFEKGITHIVGESKRLHDMVLKLLEQSKATQMADRVALVDVGYLLQDVCETMTIKAKRYKKSIQSQTVEGLLVLGQADKLKQLFINLLDNAIKYGYSHTDIKANAELVSDVLRVTFTNEGPTISAEHLSRIFEPFYRVDSVMHEADSAGLGLSICKGIVDEHLGSIRITSQSEQTLVYIELPYQRMESVQE